MSIERAMYERDWAVCQDCDTRRPVLQLCFEFRAPPWSWRMSENGVPLPVPVEGPAAPFRVCLERAWCQAQRIRVLQPRIEKAEADLVGWLSRGRRPRPGRRWRR